MNQTVVNSLRDRRLAAGLSQAELAARTAVTRQTVNSIETGKYTPGTELSLRLAEALGCRIEDIFRLSGRATDIEWVSPQLLTGGERVALGRVGERLVAHTLSGSRMAPDAFVAADAHIADDGMSLLLSEQQISRTVLVAGCDPSLSILAAFVSRASAQHRVVLVHSPSEGALADLTNRFVHVAGTHLPGGRRHNQNISHARRALSRSGGLVIRYATWEQGIVVAHGNPRRIRDMADFARRDVHIVNRDSGSGSRKLLDAGLTTLSITPDSVRGYDTVVSTHMAVARRIQAGVADAGIALRAVAHACGLDFVPVAEHHFDLVIPAEHLDQPAVRIVLEVLQSRTFRADLAALPGYEVSTTGSTLLDLKAA